MVYYLYRINTCASLWVYAKKVQKGDSTLRLPETRCSAAVRNIVAVRPRDKTTTRTANTLWSMTAFIEIERDECGYYVGFKLALSVLFQREVLHEGDLLDYEPSLDQVAEMAVEFLVNQFQPN